MEAFFRFDEELRVARRISSGAGAIDIFAGDTTPTIRRDRVGALMTQYQLHDKPFMPTAGPETWRAVFERVYGEVTPS